MASQEIISQPALLRWYIDTRKLSPTSTPSLPLLSTLQQHDQEKVTKFYHLADQQMSLASNLLKYLFVHRTCKVPWSQITISRTPAPHHRPCYIQDPTLKATTTGPSGSSRSVEFNVSHQASLVALAGTVFYTGPDSSQAHLSTRAPPSTSKSSCIPQVGIDITCVNEPSRNGRSRSRSEAITTQQVLTEYVSMFSEVFSKDELETIKRAVPPPAAVAAAAAARKETNSEQETQTGIVSYRLRLFYTYWALKEAYIKMTGEALLAPWLRELEFWNVVAPHPPRHDHHPSSSLSSSSTSSPPESRNSFPWGRPYTNVDIYLHGRRVDDVRIEIVAFEEDYIVATAARGNGIGSVPALALAPGHDPGFGPSNSLRHVSGNSVAGDGSIGRGVDDPWQEMEEIDFQKDIAPCAREECHCLEEK